MKVICYGLGSGDAIASKNCLYLSTSSTSRFLNETGGAFAGQWSEQENANLAKITTKICCKEQSLWEGGYISLSVFFHYLFVRILPCKGTHKSWKVFFSLSDGQMEGDGHAGNTLVDRPTQLV